jgi:hypothetical protein
MSVPQMVTGQDRVQPTLFAMQVALEASMKGIRGAPRRARKFLHHNAALSFQRKFELLAIQADRFGSQHVFMSAVDRVLCDVASNIRPPTFQRRRTRNPLIRQSRKDDYITIEKTGFVSSMQRKATIKVLNTQIEKLLVLRKFYGSSFAD